METLSSLDTERLLATFLEMVRIDSPSGDEGRMRDYLADRLDALSIPHRTDDGGNLIADIPGHQSVHDSILVLSGHMDVVPPCLGVQPVVEGEGDERIVYSDNTTVLGADDKAGLAVILESLAHSMRAGTPRPAVRLLFTTREETMLGGAKDLSDEALKANFAVTLDHTGEQGVIIHQAPSYYEFTVECRGKSVHAGIMPEKGVNALVYASRVIERLNLGRLDPLTTANIGFVEAGKGTNIVPDKAVFRGELRGHEPERLMRELEHIRQVLEEEKAHFPGASYTFDYEESFRAYRIGPEHVGVRLVSEAARQTGLTPRLIATNGGSDNNVFILRGLPGIVLSAGYIEPHSLKERVQLKELSLCARFMLNILKEFAAHAF